MNKFEKEKEQVMNSFVKSFKKYSKQKVE